MCKSGVSSLPTVKNCCWHFFYHVNIVKFIVCVCGRTKLFFFTYLGLYGTSGILPAHAVINLREKGNLLEKIYEQPTLLHLAPKIGLNVQYMMELFALLGAFFSFFG